MRTHLYAKFQLSSIKTDRGGKAEMANDHTHLYVASPAGGRLKTTIFKKYTSTHYNPVKKW